MDDAVTVAHQAPAPSILDKAFAILETFSRSHRVLTLSEISRRSGLPKSTVHRVTKMLVELGGLERQGDTYWIGTRMFSFGSRSPEIALLREVARPHLQLLAHRTGQVVQLAELHDHDVLYLEKLGGPEELTPVSVGDRLSAHLTALGKAILAYSEKATTDSVLRSGLERRTAATVTDPNVLAEMLGRVRVNRYATDDEEAARGLRCVAAPILRMNKVIAAVSVAFPTTIGSGHVFVGALHETVIRIARSLPSSGTYPLATR